MKKIKLIPLFILFGYTTYSQQNLVPNPSFEIITSCPDDADYIWYAEPWFQPFKFMNSVILGSSSDLYTTCALYNPVYGCYPVKVPDNCYVGYQWPRTGNNYAGIGVWGLNDWNREYIEVKLISPLDSGHTYCIEYYVVLADIPSPAPFMITGTDCLHAAFAPDSVTIDGANLIPLQPAIANTPGIIINDTANWTKISGTYIAQGWERFLLLGNFFTNDYCMVQDTINGYFTYYLIDDVSVVLCDAATVSVPNVFTPNNDGINDYFSITVWGYEKIDYTIYNRWGNEIKHEALTIENDNSLKLWDGGINGSKASEGIYYYIINLEKQGGNNDTKKGFIQLIK